MGMRVTVSVADVRTSVALALIAVLLALSLLSSNPASAIAHHEASPNTQLWGSSYARICEDDYRSQCVANNTAHRYQFVGLSSQRLDASQRALTLYSDNSEVAALAVTSDPDVVVISA